MKYLPKITILIIALLMATIPSITTSLGMESKSMDYSPKSERCRQVLASMLIDNELVGDVCDKVLIINHAFQSLDMLPLPEISCTIAQFYYQLKMNESIRNAGYVHSNENPMTAVHDRSKFILFYLGKGGFLGSKLTPFSKGDVIDEVLILDEQRTDMSFDKHNNHTTPQNFIWLLSSCSFNVFKIDPSITTEYLNKLKGYSFFSDFIDSHLVEDIYLETIIGGNPQNQKLQNLLYRKMSFTRRLR